MPTNSVPSGVTRTNGPPESPLQAPSIASGASMGKAFLHSSYPIMSTSKVFRMSGKNPELSRPQPYSLPLPVDSNLPDGKLTLATAAVPSRTAQRTPIDLWAKFGTFWTSIMSENKSACGVPAFNENTVQCAGSSAFNCKDEIYKQSPAKTSFFVYLYEFRQILRQGGAKKLKQVDICKTAGKRWRQMSECQKERYKLWALKNREKARCLKKDKTQEPKPWMPRMCFNCWRQEADITSQACPYSYIVLLSLLLLLSLASPISYPLSRIESMLVLLFRYNDVNIVDAYKCRVDLTISLHPSIGPIP
uniref:HMG box domain-containing protein n=1 Tax=Glossina austeni TaxID=7395 RepID=A0A1A9VDF3_GLOAU